MAARLSPSPGDAPPPPPSFPTHGPQLPALPSPATASSPSMLSGASSPQSLHTLSPRPEARRARPLRFLGALPVLNVPPQQDLPALVLSRGLIAKPRRTRSTREPHSFKTCAVPTEGVAGSVVGRSSATTEEGQRPANEPQPHTGWGAGRGGEDLCCPPLPLVPIVGGLPATPHPATKAPAPPGLASNFKEESPSRPVLAPTPSRSFSRPLPLHPGSRHMAQARAWLPPPQQPLASRTSPRPALEIIR